MYLTGKNNYIGIPLATRFPPTPPPHYLSQNQAWLAQLEPSFAHVFCFLIQIEAF